MAEQKEAKRERIDHIWAMVNQISDADDPEFQWGNLKAILIEITDELERLGGEK